MTKREREQREWMQTSVERLGFTSEEFHALRRISMTLHRWHERECNGNIQREGDNSEGKPCWHSSGEGKGHRIADRERGALKRLAKIMESHAARRNALGAVAQTFHPSVVSYVQGDPRGAALYLVPASELRGQPIESTYSRGIAIY